MNTLQDLITNSDNIVFFGGAGTSTESGIPDFRSVDGLYNMHYDYPPETILSHDFFMEKPKEFFQFYHEKIMDKKAQPNAAHIKLAQLEKAGKLKAIITQNIDGLHQAAGSQNVWELHGSVHRNHCRKCGKFYDGSFVQHADTIPFCSCGGIIKPDVVLYGEGLDEEVLSRSIDAIKNCDVLIVGGTSLSVYPAAGLIRYYHGDKLVLINKSVTPYDKYANLCINDAIGKVLSAITI